MRSFTIYEEYYDLITLLDREEQKELVLSIIEYMFNDKTPELNDRQNKIFKNLKRPLDISKNNSKRRTEKKPKENRNDNQIDNQKETHQDVNVNVNNNIYSYYENIYTRTLNPIEYETMTKWLENKSEEEIKRAIDETAKSNIDNIKYVEKVLYGSKKKSKVIPEWFNKEIPESEIEEDDFKSFVEDFRNE